MQALIAALRRGQPFPVPFESYVATTRATFAALESRRTGQPVILVADSSGSVGLPSAESLPGIDRPNGGPSDETADPH